jgi:hypothetical protein
LLVPDRDVLFGASLGQWNGADAADAAGRIRLAAQADRDGLDLFTVAATRGEDGRWIGGSVQQWVDELTTAVLDHQAAGFIYRSTDDTPADVAQARWATKIVPAVRDAITR